MTSFHSLRIATVLAEETKGHLGPTTARFGAESYLDFWAHLWKRRGIQELLADVNNFRTVKSEGSYHFCDVFVHLLLRISFRHLSLFSTLNFQHLMVWLAYL